MYCRCSIFQRDVWDEAVRNETLFPFMNSTRGCYWFFFSFPKFTWDGWFQDGDFWGIFFLLFWRENGTLLGNSHLSTGGVVLQHEHLRIPSRSWPTTGVCVCLTSEEQLFLMWTVHTGPPALKNLNNSKAILPGFWDFLSPALSVLHYVLVLGSEVLMRGWVTHHCSTVRRTKQLALMLKRTVGPWGRVFSQCWRFWMARGKVFKDSVCMTLATHGVIGYFSCLSW